MAVHNRRRELLMGGGTRLNPNLKLNPDPSPNLNVNAIPNPNWFNRIGVPPECVSVVSADGDLCEAVVCAATRRKAPNPTP